MQFFWDGIVVLQSNKQNVPWSYRSAASFFLFFFQSYRVNIDTHKLIILLDQLLWKKYNMKTSRKRMRCDSMLTTVCMYTNILSLENFRFSSKMMIQNYLNFDADFGIQRSSCVLIMSFWYVNNDNLAEKILVILVAKRNKFILHS